MIKAEILHFASFYFRFWMQMNIDTNWNTDYGNCRLCKWIQIKEILIQLRLIYNLDTIENKTKNFLCVYSMWIESDEYSNVTNWFFLCLHDLFQVKTSFIFWFEFNWKKVDFPNTAIPSNQVKNKHQNSLIPVNIHIFCNKILYRVNLLTSQTYHILHIYERIK